MPITRQLEKRIQSIRKGINKSEGLRKCQNSSKMSMIITTSEYVLCIRYLSYTISNFDHFPEWQVLLSPFQRRGNRDSEVSVNESRKEVMKYQNMKGQNYSFGIIMQIKSRREKIILITYYHFALSIQSMVDTLSKFNPFSLRGQILSPLMYT